MATRSIHQLVHTLSYGDAISGEVLALQRCLRDLGFASEIYALHVHPTYKGRAYDYREFPRETTDEVILHYSLGSPLNQLFREQSRSKRILVYHNLTPARWFQGVNPRIVKDIEHGVEELPILCSHADLLLADSSFNARELSQYGGDARVLDLPIDPKRWEGSSNEGIRAMLEHSGEMNLLHVGRIAPNKCIEDIIRTFYFIHHHLEPKSKLWLVGIDIDTELYSFALKRLAYELRLDQAVRFVGMMADSELRAMYEGSDVYMCMSEHEGFCLPVVEAMHFGLPVIAYGAGALPDTVGEGGILVRQKKHAELAELSVRLYRDKKLSNQITQAGFSRVKELSYERFAANVCELFRAA